MRGQSAAQIRDILMLEKHGRRCSEEVNPEQTTGPDGVSGGVPKGSANKLAAIFRDLQQLLSSIPKCLRAILVFETVASYGDLPDLTTDEGFTSVIDGHRNSASNTMKVFVDQDHSAKGNLL